jgi:hypothetical protein
MLVSGASRSGIVDFRKTPYTFTPNMFSYYSIFYDFNNNGAMLGQAEDNFEMYVNGRMQTIYNTYSGARICFVGKSNKAAFVKWGGTYDSLYVYDPYLHKREFMAKLNTKLRFSTYRKIYSSSPIENKIVYCDSTGLDVFVINVDTKTTEIVYSSNTTKSIPVYSPAGDKIAFIEEENNSTRIGIIDKNGLNYFNIPSSVLGPAGAYNIRWHSPNYLVIQQDYLKVDGDTRNRATLINIKNKSAKILSKSVSFLKSV